MRSTSKFLKEFVRPLRSKSVHVSTRLRRMLAVVVAFTFIFTPLGGAFSRSRRMRCRSLPLVPVALARAMVAS